VAAYELADHIARDLETLGVPGWTSTRVDGRGAHGPRRFGLLDGSNVKIETIVDRELAARVLAHVAKEFAGREVLTYAHDVDVVVESNAGATQRSTP
jgi:hypothetical protein